MAITRKSHIVNNIKSKYKGIGFWSMPEMQFATVLEAASSSNIAKSNPIFKINAPGYLFYYTRTLGKEMDYSIVASNVASSLVNLASIQSTSNYVVALLAISCSDQNNLGNDIFIPINPGKNTYIRLIRQNEVQQYSQFLFIPCRGITSFGLNIASSGWTTKTSYSGDGSNIGATPELAKHASACFSKVFAGNWMDNFPDIDFSKILDLRESHMSFFFDNKEVA